MGQRALVTLFAFLMLAVAPSALADGAVQLVMVTRAEGTLVVDVQGRVVELELGTELNPMLAPAVERGLRAMRFKPVTVDGVATAARAAFTVQLVGERVSDDLKIRFDGISFSTPEGQRSQADGADAKALTKRRMTPPHYPVELAREGLMGEVQLAFLVGADGRVEDMVVVRTTLYGSRPGRSETETMRQFEAATLRTARSWTFRLAPELATAPAKARTRFTRVVFTLDGRDPPTVKPGQWVEVLREPSRVAPWLDDDTARKAAGQLVAGNGLSPVGGEIELLKPLAGTPVL
jgi:hypothetical protein